MKIKAILFCGLMIIINVILLSGATYAWWSETITIEENVIQMGNLDVTFEAADDEQFTINYVDLEDSDGKMADMKNLYPGKAVTRYIKVKNTGTISVAYYFSILVTSRKDLANLITFTLTKEDYTFEVDKLIDHTEYFALLPGEAHVFRVDFKISEDMGNEWQNSDYNFVFGLEARQLLEIELAGDTIIG